MDMGVEKRPGPKPYSVADMTGDIFRATGMAMRGQLPKPEQLVSPGMKKIAKGIGDAAVWGWSRDRKK
jgi:hypothetical protein